MSPLRSTLPCALALTLVLAACGRGDDPRPAVGNDGGELEALPAPAAPAGGSVTGMPDAPGPGDVPLAGGASAVATPPGAVLFADGEPLPAVPDAVDGTLSPVRDAAPGLPPLEDEPEAGLSPGEPAPMGPTQTEVSATGAAEAAAAAVRTYYDAISAGDFRRAYGAWSEGGRASGRTPEQFAASFAGARIIRVSIGAPGAVEGAGGAGLVEVPVTVTSRDADGRELRQAGSFALRSSGPEGAPPSWHIVSADLRELQP